MNLKAIKLVGFKSFVDTTVIPLSTNMTAIVGPNGCGKSNVIDAIRWVIGESSAKQLRGQQMSDVIFNGSQLRKAVGKASVELIFDNSNGKMGGEYARFAEISVRRELDREGHSHYFLNGSHCRRRDIVDIFLGTGLGPRSYAIVEQGMISQLIEAKPDDLRGFLEEAVGISKYKERRRETENRIRHTEENLARLSDINEELDKQLRHLKRQASAAENYKELKQQEQLLQAESLALQWRDFAAQLSDQESKLLKQKLHEEEYMATLRNLEVEIEKTRLIQEDSHDKRAEVQQRYHQNDTEIVRLEQQNQHLQQQAKQSQAELAKTEAHWEELKENVAEYHQQLIELREEVTELEPKGADAKVAAIQAKEDLQRVEDDMRRWQQGFDQCQAEVAKSSQQVEVIRTKMAHYQQQLSQVEKRRADLQKRQIESPLDTVAAEINPLLSQTQLLRDQLSELELKLEETSDGIRQQRENNSQLQVTNKQVIQQLQQKQQRCAQLEALQQSALGSQDDYVRAWLEEHGLQNNLRLAQVLNVASGWELALETVLNSYFDAVCVNTTENYLEPMTTWEQGRLTLVAESSVVEQSEHKATTLAGQVQSDLPISIYYWLKGIYIADTLEHAKEIRKSLQPDESVITREGIWLGNHWIRVLKATDHQSGILAREQELKQLHLDLNQLQQQSQELHQTIHDVERTLHVLEAERDEEHRTYQRVSTELTEAQTKLSAKQSRLTELQQQQQHILEEIEECQEQIEQVTQVQEETTTQMEILQQTLTQQTQQKETLLAEGEGARSAFEKARQFAQQQQQFVDELTIRTSSNQNQLRLLEQTLIRDERQLQQQEQQCEILKSRLEESEITSKEIGDKLQMQLEFRSQVGEEQKVVENDFQQINQKLVELMKQHQECNGQLEFFREALQSLQIEKQSISVRQATIQEQLMNMQMMLEDLLPTLSEQGTVKEWHERLEQITGKINRLGPINLAAIDEYQVIKERKEYLDKQQSDLVEALEILNEAIRKIDRETRAKFRDTYERVNQNFQALFPRIFGGGTAKLELAEEDYLKAGVIVIAQPPGKRNSTIHMLSGGEKALTAIALIFSMFQLNPAPFCILDEVDAPLDDLNVNRFCQLVTEMSAQIQFIMISHNKLTISSAKHLMGVTMQELGVSRIVSVNMEEAQALVE